MSYRKRDMGSWNQGKGCKGARKAKEREYVKRDISQQLNEQDDDFRYKYSAPHKKNEEASLRYQISWYQSTIERYKKSAMWSYLRDTLRRLRIKLKGMNDEQPKRR